MFDYFTTSRFKNESRNDEKPLAIMHIPKTAGTSVITGISQSLKTNDEVRGIDRLLLGTFDRISEFDAEVAQTIHLDERTMPESKLIMGHFSYSTLTNRYPHAQLLTFLREPLSRLLSHWVYWRCMSDEYLLRWESWRDCIELSRGTLKAFLTDPRIACQTDNLATRMLLWPDERIGNDSFIAPDQDARLLKDALSRLNSVAYSDIIENPQFHQNLNRWFKTDLPIMHLNSTARVPENLRIRLDKELDQETLSLLDDRCRLDAKLWSLLAIRRFPKGVKIPSLQRQIAMRAIARYGALLAP
ncbi:sulfotransferase family 2 domain-containing protein [Burkholderia contaminans]|uniref:sulfotransferase family 2 domain-containing protein n=1 Tax=Burkholderia contaminans TaxID=488447 RepID=UPI000F560A17|nr:sulfotransferase family 2 domain-containing protein [Burkholderia contaminans]